jgi:hypothetical protein
VYLIYNPCFPSEKYSSIKRFKNLSGKIKLIKLTIQPSLKIIVILHYFEMINGIILKVHIFLGPTNERDAITKSAHLKMIVLLNF